MPVLEQTTKYRPVSGLLLVVLSRSPIPEAPYQATAITLSANPQRKQKRGTKHPPHKGKFKNQHLDLESSQTQMTRCLHKNTRTVREICLH